MNPSQRAGGLGFCLMTFSMASLHAVEGFVPTGSMAATRYGHTATLLPDGRVLVAGGYTTVTNVTPFFTQVLVYPLASTELYDPSTGTWTSGAPMNVPRDGHTATLLRNGSVLVVGGPSDPLLGEFFGSTLATCELYDPTHNSWRPTTPLLRRRQLHTATLLADGRVLIAGGENAGGPLPNETSECELYDPTLEQWVVTGSFSTTTGELGSTGRFRTATLLLPSGEVLVAGGSASFYGLFGGIFTTTVAEIFNPNRGTWRSTGSMKAPRESAALIPLPDQTVLIVPGAGFPKLRAELYDPATETWSQTTEMVSLRNGSPAVGLDDGRVLVAGGVPSDVEPVNGWSRYMNQSEIFDPSSGTWSATSPLRHPRKEHTLTLLLDGRVLIAGGREDTTTELFTPEPQLGLRIQWNQDHPILVLQGPVGSHCLLESKDTLQDLDWTLLNSRTLATPRESFVDSLGSTRFYRLRSIP